MAYSIPAINISYPMQVSPNLFSLRSTLALFCSVLYFQGSPPTEESVPGPHAYYLLFHLVQGTRRNWSVGGREVRIFPPTWQLQEVSAVTEFLFKFQIPWDKSIMVSASAEFH